MLFFNLIFSEHWITINNNNNKNNSLWLLSGASQVSFIYTALLTIQTVSKQQNTNSVSVMQKKYIKSFLGDVFLFSQHGALVLLTYLYCSFLRAQEK